MAEELQLIKMRRGEPSHPGGPTAADVHPDEEANYARAGWERTPEESGERTPGLPSGGPREELLAKSKTQLLEIATEYKADFNPQMTKPQLADAILKAAGYKVEGQESQQ